MDAKASRYAASIRVQAGREEIIVDLVNMAKELLKTFYQTCGRKPERILFYRDGVSEGQFAAVLNSEIKAVKGKNEEIHIYRIHSVALTTSDYILVWVFFPNKAACQALDAQYKPTITFVVVQKRHHTRFFPMNKNESDRSGNCMPGTVVETTIIHPSEFDFCKYLSV